MGMKESNLSPRYLRKSAVGRTVAINKLKRLKQYGGCKRDNPSPPVHAETYGGKACRNQQDEANEAV